MMRSMKPADDADRLKESNRVRIAAELAVEREQLANNLARAEEQAARRRAGEIAVHLKARKEAAGRRVADAEAKRKSLFGCCASRPSEGTLHSN